jgi:nucleotide-binding universal stress UspA family protein
MTIFTHHSAIWHLELRPGSMGWQVRDFRSCHSIERSEQGTKMSNENRLVFGDDHSAGSDVAWLFINSQTWPGWRLKVVTAVEPPFGPPLSAEDTTLHAWSPPATRVEYNEAQFELIEYLTTKSDPRLVLLTADADLTVIGPRGPGLLKALHLGSTAEWMLHNSSSPILVARHGQTVRRVVLCTDGSPHAKRATEVLAAMPWIDGLNVTVLAIADGRVDVEVSARRARDQLESCGADVTVSFGPVNVGGVLATMGVASPTSLISQYLEEVSPDLVVLGTRGLTGLKRLRLGSTASAIARTAACSILLARVEDD